MRPKSAATRPLDWPRRREGHNNDEIAIEADTLKHEVLNFFKINISTF